MAIEPFLGTRAQKGFLATVVIQGIIVLSMVAICYGIVDKNVDTTKGAYKTLPCYLALFALAEVFEIIVAVDALKLRNIIQLIGILCFHTAMIVFSALQVGQTKEALVTAPGTSCVGPGYVSCSGPGSLYDLVHKFLIISPIILSASLVILAYWVRELYLEFGWVVFHVVGANPEMKKMYHYYQILICLLKFDFFCFTALTIQLLILVLSRSGAEFPLTIIAIPVVLVLIIACVFAVKQEIKWLMTLSLILMLGAQAYFLYKFIRLFTRGNRDNYRATRGTLAVFLIVSFLMLLATFVIGLRCFSDFDKNLRGAKTIDIKLDARPKSNYSLSGLPGSIPVTPAIGDRQSSYLGGAPLGPRMSIE